VTGDHIPGAIKTAASASATAPRPGRVDTLDVFNLLNAQVDDIAYKSRLPGEPVARADVHLHPAESRSVRVTTVVSF
jgi:hypothetical protein